VNGQALKVVGGFVTVAEIDFLADEEQTIESEDLEELLVVLLLELEDVLVVEGR
jgi:hypothetical protein